MQKCSVHFAAAVSLFLVFSLSIADTAPISESTTMNLPNATDNAAIHQLLDNYTQSVSTGDRKLFESQLLDLSIPFSRVDEKAGGTDKLEFRSIQDYARFRQSIFDSNIKFKQRFSNVKIEQLRNVAQVSLDYETTLQGQEYAGKGWKILQLIKVKGQWKIVSELFTGGY